MAIVETESLLTNPASLLSKPQPIPWLRYEVLMRRDSDVQMGRITFKVEMVGAESEDAAHRFRLYWCPHCAATINPTMLDPDEFVPCMECGRPSLHEDLPGRVTYFNKDRRQMADIVAGFVDRGGYGEVSLGFDDGPLSELANNPEAKDDPLWLDRMTAARQQGKRVIYPKGRLIRDTLTSGLGAGLYSFINACV